MNQQLATHRRRARRRSRGSLAEALQRGGPVAAGFAYPGIPDVGDGARRTWVTGSFAALLHMGGLGLLVLLASLAPVIEEELIPVQLLREPEPPPPEEPAPAPKALAERRLPRFAPQVQSVAPQIVNPTVVAEAQPAVAAESLEMESVQAARAPTAIDHQSLKVERVSRVNSLTTARAAAVDVPRVVAPSVRGPVKVEAPVGPSVGPRQVAVATPVRSMGTATFEIGGEGSSVQEGVLGDRDVLGSADGEVLVNVETEVGEGFLRGSGGRGSGLGPRPDEPTGSLSCQDRSEVRDYMGEIHDRTYKRWRIPPGTPDSVVVLSFTVDVAGTASDIRFLDADDNALGASAVDAMRAASPFPPIPQEARCLAHKRIRATFRTDSVAG